MDQNIACRRLIAAVVATAIEDACRGAKHAKLTSDAASAFSFLFIHSNEYLSLIEIDADGFRKRLLSYASKRNSFNQAPFNLSDMERRNFLINFRKWNKYQNMYEQSIFEEEEA